MALTRHLSGAGIVDWPPQGFAEKRSGVSIVLCQCTHQNLSISFDITGEDHRLRLQLQDHSAGRLRQPRTEFYLEPAERHITRHVEFIEEEATLFAGPGQGEDQALHRVDAPVDCLDIIVRHTLPLRTEGGLEFTEQMQLRTQYLL